MNTQPDPRQGLRPTSSSDSLKFEPIVSRTGGLRIAGVAAAAVAVVFLFAGTPTARAAWQEISQLLSLHGKPEPASANVLSEHETEALDQMSPQAQAQLLLERSINHYRGANDQIAGKL